MKKEQKKLFETFDQFATALGMIVIILTVIYGDDDYDIWDLTVGVLLTWGIVKYKQSLRITETHIWLSRIGLSISIAVILVSSASLLFSITKNPLFEIDYSGFWDKDFLIALFIGFPVSLLLLRNSR